MMWTLRSRSPHATPGALARILLPLACLAAGGPLGAQAPEPPSDLWKDPTFQKEFLGSYGVNSELEPRLSQIELQEMRKVMALMGSDTQAATRKLEELAKPAANAIFDFVLGNLYFQQQDLDRAAERYATAIRKFPNFRRAHKNLGLVLVRSGRTDEAVKSLGRAIELGEADALTYGLLGTAYNAGQQFVSAESAFRTAVLLQPEQLDWKLGLAHSLLRQRKYAEAVSLSDELLAARTDRPELWALQAGAYLGLGQPLKAAQDYEILHRMGRATLQSLYALGDIYANEGLWDLAVRCYGQALDLDPGRGLQETLRRAQILAQRGALPQARDLAARLKVLSEERGDDTQKKELLRLQARLAVGDGGGGEEVELLEQLVSLDPLDGEALMMLGQHFARAADPERAALYYERAESIEATEADARLRHAQLLVGLSRYQDAIPLLRRSQELKPRDDVARYLEQVERVARSRR